jgi:sec-independent protein translocase protein TatC
MNPVEQEELQASPLLEHLIELRRRVMIIMLAWIAAFVLCYIFVDHIYGFLMQPLAESFADGQHRRLIFTSLPETFFTYVKLAAYAGFFVSFPVIAAQVYAFLAPALYRNEKRAFVPYLIAAPLLFLAGAALAYYYVFPLAWQFFVSFETPAGTLPMPVELEAKVADYLALVLQILLAFGLAFQLPVALTLLARAGIVSSAGLAKARKYALLIIVTASAFLTPPDILSQIALSIPLYLLYELSILSCKIIEKKRLTAETAHA